MPFIPRLPVAYRALNSWTARGAVRSVCSGGWSGGTEKFLHGRPSSIKGAVPPYRGCRQFSSSQIMTRKAFCVYEGAFIHPRVPSTTNRNIKPGLEFVPRGRIIVENGSGKIVLIQRDNSSENGNSNIGELLRDNGINEADLEYVRAPEGAFFFPGFFDTHIHAPQYPNSGIFGESTLLDWLETYTFPMEASLSDTDRAKAVYSKVIEKTLGNGTTTASYYATIHPEPTQILADEALRQGQRAFVGRVCMVQNSPDYYVHTEEESKAADEQVIAYIKKRDPQGEIISPIVTPRFAPSCTEHIMEWQAKLAKRENLPIQTHISENTGEVEWVKELFPKCSGYADVYDKAGLLTDRTILAHCVHLTEDEKHLIHHRQSGISHCPISNSSLTSGECPVRSLLNKEIKVSLGTDVSGGYSPSILAVARQALLVSRHIAMKSQDKDDVLNFEEVLYLATYGGAEVCGLADKLGSFEVGKKWDAQLVSLDHNDSPIDVFPFATSSLSKEQRLRHSAQQWIYLGDDRNTRKVWVNGQLVINKDGSSN
uniref:Guanine deaminase n=2 Tax=Blastobotrys adeninivorans TaxID=409370 RepID=A0A060TEY9_BLAAD